ncbi:glutamine--tRNA ligase [Ranunculus cassubicifolius]
MGNKDTAEVVGKGTIRLEMSTGCTLLLKEVRHVPDLRLSLISTGKLDDEGYYNTFGNGMWKLTKDSLVVAKGKKEGSLYKTRVKLSGAQLNAIEGSYDIWHQ